jgi:hypothetical protein
VFRNHLQNQHNIIENKDCFRVKRKHSDVLSSSDYDSDFENNNRQNLTAMSLAKIDKLDKKIDPIYCG